MSGYKSLEKILNGQPEPPGRESLLRRLWRSFWEDGCINNNGFFEQVREERQQRQRTARRTLLCAFCGQASATVRCESCGARRTERERAACQ